MAGQDEHHLPDDHLSNLSSLICVAFVTTLAQVIADARPVVAVANFGVSAAGGRVVG